MTEKIEIVTENKIDKNDWSAFVLGHELGNIFQSPEMAEVYKKAKNHELLPLFGVNENEEIVSVMSGVIRKEKSGLLKPFTSWSLVIGGPIFNNPNAGIRIIQMYDKVTHKKAIYSEIRMLSDPTLFNEVLIPQGYLFEDHFGAIIQLDKPKDQLWKQLKDDKRKGVNKAKRLGITIEECHEKEHLEIFYTLLKETYNRVRMPLPHISFYEAIFERLVPQNKAKFLFAKYNNEYIATQLALIYKDTIYAFITGTITKYLKYHPGDLLIWHLLEWGSENGFKTFDFGGGGTPTKNQNIRYYKSRFGAEFPNYGRFKKVYSPAKMRIADIGFYTYRRLKGVIR